MIGDEQNQEWDKFIKYVVHLQAYEDAINKFKASKDQSKFTNDRKKIEMDHKALTSQIGNLQAKLKADSIETADKVLVFLNSTE